MNKLLESLSSYNDEKLEERPLIFRNYVPRDPELSRFIVAASTVVAEVEINIERDVKNALRDYEKQQTEPLAIAPKKANCDIKRNLERKLEKIQKITQESISKLRKRKAN